MKEESFNHEEINKLINGAMKEEDAELTMLRSIFEKRLAGLNITPNQAVENLGIEYRTLYGILDGTLKRLDVLSLLKIAQFLEIPYNEITEPYLKAVSDKHINDLAEAKKRIFILNHFDLPVLKSINVIDSIRDFAHIEQQLCSIFGISSITEYNIEDTGAAFSSTKIKPKNDKSRKYFIKKSELIFELIQNPHPYEKQALIEYFPKIRWHSTDVDNGILNVIRSLYILGITVIFQPKMPSLQLRGATFAVNGKPCIVLTDYRESYPTLWFAFLHELFHVFFDWEEILKKCYHLSDEENDLFVVPQKEDEANEFAREYLFPKQKMELISSRIEQRVFIKQFAIDNHVHPSIIYANYAYGNNNKDINLWAQFQKFMPPIKNLLKNLSNDLAHKLPASDFASYYKNNIFNKE